MRDFCFKCGAPMVFRARPAHRFDEDTGLPLQFEYRVCPKWRSFFAIGNGHSWRLWGVNPINPPADYLPDPGKMQSPPSPRGAT